MGTTIHAGTGHWVDCSFCGGTGGDLIDSGAWRNCELCNGRKFIAGIISPDDCECEACVLCFWFFPANGDLPERYSTMTEALVGTRNRPGEITERMTEWDATKNPPARRKLVHAVRITNI